jgi:guanylate kinase
LPGKLVILSGPSGVGKDTVLDQWQATNPDVERVVAYTSRSPRSGERDGVDYHFVSVEEFHRMAAAGEFLEFKEVHGNWYATPLSGMQTILDAGKIAVLKIDVQGALEVMPKLPDAITIFLLPPTLQELERRLRGRGSEDEARIQKRLDNAKAELEAHRHYRFHVINQDIEYTVVQLSEIVRKAS